MEESERPTEERYPAIIAAYMLQRNYLSIYLLPESVTSVALAVGRSLLANVFSSRLRSINRWRDDAWIGASARILKNEKKKTE